MYNNSNENPPKPPIITTLTAANLEVAKWQKASQFDSFVDLEGLKWNLAVVVNQVPDLHDSRKVVWRIAIKVTISITADELIETGTLDRVKDARLIGLLGTDIIPMAMKPIVYTVKNEEQARQIVASTLPKLKANFPKNSLDETKRLLVCRWINEQAVFGV